MPKITIDVETSDLGQTKELRLKAIQSKLIECAGCGAKLLPIWLKDGQCNGCRNPHLIVSVITEETYRGIPIRKSDAGFLHNGTRWPCMVKLDGVSMWFNSLSEAKGEIDRVAKANPDFWKD